MHVFALVAQLRELAKNDSTDKHLFGSESIGKRWVVLEDLSELTHDVKSLENCIDTVIPLDLSLSKVAISVVQVAKLVQSLDKHVLFLSLAKQLNALLVGVDYHVGKDPMALAL